MALVLFFRETCLYFKQIPMTSLELELVMINGYPAQFFSLCQTKSCKTPHQAENPYEVKLRSKHSGSLGDHIC